jgi:hypothetical protein
MTWRVACVPHAGDDEVDLVPVVLEVGAVAEVEPHPDDLQQRLHEGSTRTRTRQQAREVIIIIMLILISVFMTAAPPS